MTHQIVDGSLEYTDIQEEDGEERAFSITGAVTTNNDPRTIRYIKAWIKDGQEDDTVNSLMFRTYDNSTGCLARGGFRMNA